jgi:multidrug efflux pump
MDKFNLSKWALDHPALTRYLMVVLMLLGVAAYFQLGQDEDPPFTFRAMVVRTYWPGATAQQVAEQVTDKLERTLQGALCRQNSQLFQAWRVANYFSDQRLV